MLVKCRNTWSGLGFFLFFVVGLCVAFQANAQKTEVNGRVTDAESGEPIPFANVVFTGTNTGVTTDFDGFFKIQSTQKYDSVTVSYIGYHAQKKPIIPRTTQTINFQLQESVINLKEIVVHAGDHENPAFAILRKVVSHKDQNDKNGLSAYEYESYSKVEVDINNMSDEMKKKRLIQRIQSKVDSSGKVTDDLGNPVLPMFISESLSKFYYRNNPVQKKEEILKTRVKGVGLEDGSLISQVLGSSLQDYNFYNNYIKFIDKQLVSPIADSWKFYYDYDLVDSLYVGEDYCYRLEVYPKREQDLAFRGTIWITKKEYALKQLSLGIQESANLNFIERIHIQQELMRTEAGNWLPEKTRVVTSIRPFKLTDTGFFTKYYASIENPVVNQPRESGFYRHPIEVMPDADLYPKGFWEENRHDSLSAEEIHLIQMIDTVNADPMIRRTVGVIKALGSGYIDMGGVMIGPYPFFYIYNNIERHRVGFGLRTNVKFSRRVRLGGFGAYGTGDNQFKYNLSASWILSKKHWTVATIKSVKEIEQVGLDPEELTINYFFYASSKWGKLQSPYTYRNSSIKLQSDLWKGGTAAIGFRRLGFDPLYPFEYKTDLSRDDSPVISSFTTAEVNTELRLSFNENFLYTNFNRVSLKNSKWPILTLQYTYGLKGFVGSDFEYHKVGFKADQIVDLGLFGESRYSLHAGKVFNDLPYPLLQVHTGNESFFYTTAAFSLMNYMEFVSDKFVSLRFLHNDEGVLFNKIPLMRELKWRLLLEANVVYGGLREQNREQLEIVRDNGGLDAGLRSLSDKPYIEVGYGIENIFRFIRVDAFHRLTYLDRPGVSRFGIRFSGQISL